MPVTKAKAFPRRVRGVVELAVQLPLPELLVAVFGPLYSSHRLSPLPPARVRNAECTTVAPSTW